MLCWKLIVCPNSVLLKSFPINSTHSFNSLTLFFSDIKNGKRVKWERSAARGQGSVRNYQAFGRRSICQRVHGQGLGDRRRRCHQKGTRSIIHSPSFHLDQDWQSRRDTRRSESNGVAWNQTIAGAPSRQSHRCKPFIRRFMPLFSWKTCLVDVRLFSSCSTSWKPTWRFVLFRRSYSLSVFRIWSVKRASFCRVLTSRTCACKCCLASSFSISTGFSIV